MTSPIPALTQFPTFPLSLSLPNRDAGHHQRLTNAASSGVQQAISNLIVTIVGAGMLALPRTIEEVGVIPGILIFIIVGFTTLASANIILHHGHRLSAPSYGSIVKQEFGRRGEIVLQCAILMHVFGVMVVYLITIADILVGSSPHPQGILPRLFNHKYDDCWFLTRWFVLGVLSLGIIGPLLVPRSLTSVAKFSKLGVVLILALVCIITGLAAVALVNGKAADDLHFFFPPPSERHGGDDDKGESRLDIVATCPTVFSVACLAFTCQFNLIPIQQSMKVPTEMRTVAKVALSSCAIIYILMAVSGYVLFGSNTEGDVLKNLTLDYVSRHLSMPIHLALVIVDGVGLMYCWPLMVNFVLKVWPGREAVSDLLLQKSAVELGALPFYSLTAALVLGAYVLSVLIPEMYLITTMIGATACMCLAYIFPAALDLKTSHKAGVRVRAYLMILGAAIVATLAFTGKLG